MIQKIAKYKLAGSYFFHCWCLMNCESFQKLLELTFYKLRFSGGFCFANLGHDGLANELILLLYLISPIVELLL
jgi:hypothetical protein